MAKVEIPYCRTLVASAARTSSSSTEITDFPTDLDDCMIILKSAAGTGTTPTLDVAIEVTPDDGTTYIPVLKYTQVTTSAKNYIKMVRMSRLAEAGAEVDGARTGAAVSGNTILTRKVQIYWTIGGTNPSFTFSMYLIGRKGVGTIL